MAIGERVPWIFWPFVALWRLLTKILELTGRLLALILGFVFLVVGVVVSLTVIGAVVGIPLVMLGLLLMIRSLY
jgi:hypothetical protein